MTAAALMVDPQPAWPSAEPGGGFQALVVATLVVLLVALFAWLIRRGSIRLGGGKSRTAISVETGFSLGERRALAIVTIEGRRLLLGLTPAQVSFLTELSPSPPAFTDTLDRSLGSRPEAAS